MPFSEAAVVSAPTSSGSQQPAKTSSAGAGSASYEKYVNPQWVNLLNLLNLNSTYTECRGEVLHTADGRRILDFLSGYCVYNAGHNHPAIVDALHRELDKTGPSMLQSHINSTAGELAERLLHLAGGRVKKAYFATSGSDGVETAIKFSRAHTKRSGLLAARGAFHGLTCGALALMDSGFWSDGFGAMIPGVEFVDFGDLVQLENQLATKRHAALILEPIQGEAGIVLPPAGYLEGAQKLCRKYGTVFVLDEVQTGLGRTGRFLASHHYGLDPDMVILAKALSGGLVPVGAVLMTDAIYDSVYSSLKRAIVHTSTYSESGLAMRAGLATLDVLEDEQLAQHSLSAGEAFRERLREALAPFEMVREVRGMGYFSGIVFGPPRSLALRLSFEAFARVHPAMFGQMLVMRLYREHGILTQICGNNFLVLKAAPPLNASPESLQSFITAMKSVMEYVHSSRTFWADALALAARAVRI
jgi:ornithine--oxo-acid transaminase